ncbi:MAG: bifunctional diguanylate cyclase/phosphodiesterase, partial [Firmicutes bacterium]|nr:bifunctional diguanylate cyclase/phosphodiesterase [Bacillota bacterium]
RFSNISKQCEKLKLTSVATGVDMDYSFAVRLGDSALYSILSKTTSIVPESHIEAALSRYVSESAKLTLRDVIRNNHVYVNSTIGIIVLVIIGLLLKALRAEMRAKEGRELISATENDRLTGLYNRSYFYQYVHRSFREHPEKQMDAGMLNIDNFHSVNELIGREFGDKVLCAVADCLKDYLKTHEGFAGRADGDHFAFLAAHSDDYQPLFDGIQAKLDSLAKNANVRLRMGVMPYQKGLDADTMFDRARTAVRMARGSASHLVIFDESLIEKERSEQRLIKDLRRAVDEHEFEVYYQPKYDIQSEPPVLKSAEALVRWNHHHLGMLMPGDFIPLFEKNGQIALIDKYVWRESARRIALRIEEYGKTIPVSINLSRVDLLDPELQQTLDSIVEENGIKRSMLILEITESAYTENSMQIINVINQLRESGYIIEMDDFGTGYSSLGMLSSMPVDAIKMDRAFISNVGENEKSSQLVEFILDIAKSLKLPVVAEGVETETQLQLLKRLGCDLVQGFYFSRPLPGDEFDEKLLKQK